MQFIIRLESQKKRSPLSKVIKNIADAIVAQKRVMELRKIFFSTDMEEYVANVRLLRRKRAIGTIEKMMDSITPPLELSFFNTALTSRLQRLRNSIATACIFGFTLFGLMGISSKKVYATGQNQPPEPLKASPPTCPSRINLEFLATDCPPVVHILNWRSTEKEIAQYHANHSDSHTNTPGEHQDDAGTHSNTPGEHTNTPHSNIDHIDLSPGDVIF